MNHWTRTDKIKDHFDIFWPAYLVGIFIIVLVVVIWNYSITSWADQYEFFEEITCPEVWEIIVNHEHTHSIWNNYYTDRCL